MQQKDLLKNRIISWIFYIIAGTGITISIFAFMPYLIITGSEKLGIQKSYTVDFVRLKRVRSQLKKAICKDKAKRPLLNKFFTKIIPEKRLDIKPIFDTAPLFPNLTDILPVQPEIRINLGDIKAGSIKGIFGIEEVDHPPIPIFQQPPIYPLFARIRQIEGWVKVRFIVNERGEVEDIRVIKAKPKGVFEDSVISCVSKWRFKPATVEGIKVKTVVETTIRFKLK